MPRVNSDMKYETILVPSSDYQILSYGSYGQLKEYLQEYKDSVYHARMLIPNEDDDCEIKYDMIVFDEKYRDILGKCITLVCTGDFYTDLIANVTVSIVCDKKDFLKYKIKEL